MNVGEIKFEMKADKNESNVIKGEKEERMKYYQINQVKKKEEISLKEKTKMR